MVGLRTLTDGGRVKAHHNCVELVLQYNTVEHIILECHIKNCAEPQNSAMQINYVQLLLLLLLLYYYGINAN